MKASPERKHGGGEAGGTSELHHGSLVYSDEKELNKWDISPRADESASSSTVSIIYGPDG